MPFNRIMGRTGENILLTHGLKSYLIQFEDNQCNLLEFNVAANPRKKPKYHLVDEFNKVDMLVDYVKSRRIA
jgi:hypothetical protein